MKDNVKQFNALTGLLFAKMYDRFPEFLSVEFDVFGLELVERNDGTSAFEWGEFVRSSVSWLDRYGYIWVEEGSTTNEGTCATLSQEGLRLLRSTPDALSVKEPIGERLRKLAKDKAIDAIGDLVSQLISMGLLALTKQSG